MPTDGDIQHTAISRDGKYVAYVREGDQGENLGYLTSRARVVSRSCRPPGQVL